MGCSILRLNKFPQINCSISSSKAATTSNYFGLPVGRAISAAANSDLAQKLLETHWAFGHLSWIKLNKFLGLKQGNDPHCAACAVASSRKAPQ